MPQSHWMFSRRSPDALAANRITTARRACPPRIDLTVSNPTLVGLPYPNDLLAPFADPSGLVYRPEPRGLGVSRDGVAAEYLRHGTVVDPERVTLTASTSEAYMFLFKLLCSPGDAVAVPVPSYPLFEHLGRLEAVEVLPYHLDRDHGWRIDLAELHDAPRDVRAVIVVHPNNPTGSFVDREDRAALTELCAERGWALIADEVFLDYPLTTGGQPATTFADERACLTFTLGGLSKSVGLPQAKLAWIVTSGPRELVAQAEERVEFIADAFLSVSTPVQLALPSLLERGAAVRQAIRNRCLANLATLERAVAGSPAVELLRPEGGWTAVLRFPAVIGEEELVVVLLERDGVAVHPGFFFDFPVDGYLVASLLPEPAEFAGGVAALLARLGAAL